MSVSLEEALNAAGYKLDNVEDCEWLIGKQEEFSEMIDRANNLLDLYEQYLDCKETSEEDGDYNFPSFDEWRKICNL